MAVCSLDFLYVGRRIWQSVIMMQLIKLHSDHVWQCPDVTDMSLLRSNNRGCQIKLVGCRVTKKFKMVHLKKKILNKFINTIIFMTFFIIDKCVDVKLIGYGLLTFSLAASTSFVLYYIYIYIYIYI